MLLSPFDHVRGKRQQDRFPQTLFRRQVVLGPPASSAARPGSLCVSFRALRARIRPQRGKLRPPFQFEETFLAKPNYSFEKRQREIARKKKQDEKRQRKVKSAPDEPAPVDQQTQPTPPKTDTAA